jgi:Arc/MetJ-type ribon-helix-helix transcriptional regulator
MTLTLDAQLEQRIQRVQANGNYREPADVIDEALTLLESEQQLLEAEKTDLNARLDRSAADAQAGRVYSADEAAHLLDQRIAERAMKKAS